MEKKTIRLNISKAVHETMPDRVRGLFIVDIIDADKSDTSYIFDECSIILCQQGKGIIQINERQYTLSSNSILFIPPGYLTRKIEINPDFRGKALFFSLDFIADIIPASDHSLGEPIRKKACIQISKEKMEELLEYYTFLEKQYRKNDSTYQTWIIKNLLFAVLIKIAEIYSIAKEDNKPENTSRAIMLTDRFFDLVVIHYKEERSLSFYADKMCVSRKHLSTTLKNVTGQSGLNWINDYIIMKAKVLIKTSGMTYAEISDMMNFPNPSFFGRLFKKHTGMTPGEYRKS